MTMIKTRAAVAWAPTTADHRRSGPDAAAKARCWCASSPAAYATPTPGTLSGKDSEGVFPVFLAMKALAWWEAIGEGVTSVAVGDHVIPLYTPECGECKFCLSGKTNLCQAIRATQGRA